jgi:hypothetical protein
MENTLKSQKGSWKNIRKLSREKAIRFNEVCPRSVMSTAERWLNSVLLIVLCALHVLSLNPFPLLNYRMDILSCSVTGSVQTKGAAVVRKLFFHP